MPGLTENRTESDDETREQQVAAADGLEQALKVTDKKKKKRKGRSGKKKKKIPSGFEEFFADAPTTPHEAHHERTELYAPDVPFAVRMQTCIYRFRTRRRLSPELTLYFNEYLFIGGIDFNNGPFSGQDAQDPSFISSLERRDDALAEIVHGPGAETGRFYDGNPTDWTIDFTGVVSGFLSTCLPYITGLDLDCVERAITVVESFLRYVAQHDVCPEYKEDINGALRVASQAREEVPAMTRFNASLPGLFNLSASRLFTNMANNDWPVADPDKSELISPEMVFYTSLVALGDSVTTEPEIEVMRQYEAVLKLSSIETPTSQIINRFRRVAAGPEKTPLGCEPLGKAIFVPAAVEDGWVDPRPQKEDCPGHVELYFETSILANMTTGLLLSTTICELSSGLSFVKAIEATYPSFYTFLPQQLMKGFKPPRLGERPAPSIHDTAGPGPEAGGAAGGEAEAEAGCE